MFTRKIRLVLSLLIVLSVLLSSCSVKSIRKETEATTTTYATQEFVETSEPDKPDERISDTVLNFLASVQSGDFAEQGYTDELVTDQSLFALNDIESVLGDDLASYLSSLYFTIQEYEENYDAKTAYCSVLLYYRDPELFLRSSESTKSEVVAFSLEYDEKSDLWIITDLGTLATLIVEPLADVSLVIYSYTDEIITLLDDYYLPQAPDFNYYCKLINANKYVAELEASENSTGAQPDMFLLEGDEEHRSFIESGFALDIAELGLDYSMLESQFPYTYEYMTDSQGKIRALSWMACPGVTVYNKDLAEEYLGVSDPAGVQPFFESWDSFLDTAREINDASDGEVKIASGQSDYWLSYSNSRTQSWLLNDEIIVDPQMEAFYTFEKTMQDESLSFQTEVWSDDWFSGMTDGSVLAYWGPLWFINFCIYEDGNSTESNWGIVAPPTSFFWGGVWIAASDTCRDKERAADIMTFLTLDEESMAEMVPFVGFSNNINVINDLKQSNKSQVLDFDNSELYGTMYDVAMDIECTAPNAFSDAYEENFLLSVNNYADGTIPSVAKAIALFETCFTGPDNEPSDIVIPTPPPAKENTDTFYLKIPMQVTTNTDEIITLAAGTILFIGSDSYPIAFDANSVYATIDDTQVFFEITESDSGYCLFSGKPASAVFGTSDSNMNGNGEEVILEAWEQLDHAFIYDQIIMQVDWNRDGTVDKLCLENREDWVVVFTDGKTGNITESVISDSSDEYYWINIETVLLFQKSSGEYAFYVCEDITTLLEDCEGSSTLFYTYDPVTILKYTENYGAFGYFDGQFYHSGYSEFLGYQWTTMQTIDLNDDFSYTINSDTEYYANGWMDFSYTLEDVAAEVYDSSEYKDFVLPAGTVVFPEKTVIDRKTGKGYLYVTLADGRNVRMKISYDALQSEALINGIPQDQLFPIVYGC